MGDPFYEGYKVHFQGISSRAVCFPLISERVFDTIGL